MCVYDTIVLDSLVVKHMLKIENFRLLQNDLTN